MSDRKHDTQHASSSAANARTQTSHMPKNVDVNASYGESSENFDWLDDAAKELDMVIAQANNQAQSASSEWRKARSEKWKQATETATHTTTVMQSIDTSEANTAAAAAAKASLTQLPAARATRPRAQLTSMLLDSSTTATTATSASTSTSTAASHHSSTVASASASTPTIGSASTSTSAPMKWNSFAATLAKADSTLAQQSIQHSQTHGTATPTKSTAATATPHQHANVTPVPVAALARQPMERASHVTKAPYDPIPTADDILGGMSLTDDDDAADAFAAAVTRTKPSMQPSSSATSVSVPPGSTTGARGSHAVVAALPSASVLANVDVDIGAGAIAGLSEDASFGSDDFERLVQDA